ncbi:MAG: hypothetical protein WDN09_04245 [bacterium]
MDKTDFESENWFITRYDKHHGVRISKREDDKVIYDIECMIKYGMYGVTPTNDTPKIVHELLSITGVNLVAYDPRPEKACVRFINVNSYYRENEVLNPAKFILSKYKNREPVLY